MKKVSLVQVEVSGIQRYIFASNHLPQNIGASELVARSTTQWVLDALDEIKVKHNVRWRADGYFASQLEFIEPVPVDLQAKVIYAGGGNALLLFVEEGAHQEHSKQFTKSLTFRALKEAIELSLVVGKIEFDWESQAAASQHLELRKLIAKRKLNRMPSIALPGLGVTATCTFTGLPAVAFDEEGRLLSQAVCHKLQASKQVNQSLSHILPEGFELMYDFDLFGEKGKSSYIAVVHTDGNSMGKRFEAIADTHPSPSDNQAYLNQLRTLSQSVRDKATQALTKTIDKLLQSYDEESKCFGKVVPAPEKDGKRYLPFRPLVFGGDDTTFVCEGRLGLSLAAQYLRELAQGELPGAKEGEAGEPFYARAGIAVVNSHYPFSRAYQLAEELSNSAKEKLPSLTRDGKGIVMDWHFSTSGIVRSLSEIRQREYVATDGKSLLMRPVRLDLGVAPKGARYWRSYANLEHVITGFKYGPQWKSRRNKIKALRTPLRQGAESVKLFRANYDLPLLPEIPFQSKMPETGWNGENSGYFDAIEALDFYVPLNNQQEEAK